MEREEFEKELTEYGIHRCNTGGYEQNNPSGYHLYGKLAGEHKQKLLAEYDRMATEIEALKLEVKRSKFVGWK